MRRMIEIRAMPQRVIPDVLLVCVWLAWAWTLVGTAASAPGQRHPLVESICICVLIAMQLRSLACALRERCRIVWDDERVEVYYRRARGDFVKWDRIRCIREDHVSFHLFHGDDEAVIKKKGTPTGLLAKLEVLAREISSPHAATPDSHPSAAC